MANIIKIGLLDLPENRWLDALSRFDEIYNIVLNPNETNRLNEPRIRSIYLVDFNDTVIRKKINSAIMRLLINRKNINGLVFWILVKTFRFLNYRRLSRIINDLDYEYCHSSYNDYDNSDLITIILKPYLKTQIIRVQKETRPEFSIKEKECFNLADVLVFNSRHNLNFFQEKYGRDLFLNKKVLFDLDEDWRKYKVWEYPVNYRKLSSIDGNKHVVILTGTAHCTPNNKRSGSRQFYINLINDLLSFGLCVHLHAINFELDENGVNLYEQIALQQPRFKLHSSLDFVNDTNNAYVQLASYDFGILHNFIDGTSVSFFDRYNVPHRFFEYQIANVVPVILENQTIVVEDLIKIHNCGLILADYSELQNQINLNDIKFLTPSFKDYINQLYKEI